MISQSSPSPKLTWEKRQRRPEKAFRKFPNFQSISICLNESNGACGCSCTCLLISLNALLTQNKMKSQKSLQWSFLTRLVVDKWNWKSRSLPPSACPLVPKFRDPFLSRFHHHWILIVCQVGLSLSVCHASLLYSCFHSFKHTDSLLVFWFVLINITFTIRIYPFAYTFGQLLSFCINWIQFAIPRFYSPSFGYFSDALLIEVW